jgi:osmoprotectant transport system substrate-binding protein
VRRPWRIVVALVCLVFAAGCGASPAPPPSGVVRADLVGPAEITANVATSPLPAGTPGVGRPAVVIGTKDFSEQFLLGDLYAAALRAKGFTVTLDQNVGDTEIIDSAFASNQIAMYPEYLGEIASGLAQAPAAGSPLQTYQQAAQFEQTQRAATILLQTPYQNTDVLVVRRELAERYGLRSVPDLANIGPAGRGVRVAAQPPFRTRSNGLVGMQQVYGLTNVQFLAVGPDETYSALEAGQAEVADGFSTDAQLTSGRYVELDDPRNIFGFQYVAPVVKQTTLAQAGPAFAQTCNWVSGLLTVGNIRAMNQQVQLGGADEATVATEFLTQHGLR